MILPSADQPSNFGIDDGKSLTAQIVDFFTDPGQTHNLGLSRPGFRVFADESDGIVENVSWTIV